MEDGIRENLSCRAKFSIFLVAFMEKLFYRHGKFVASHPISVLIATFAICALSSLGFLNIHMESKPEKLWIPQESDFVKTLEWQQKGYPDNLRLEMVVFQAENVLNPIYIREMFYLKEQIQSIIVTDSSGRNRTREDLCYRVPALGGRTKEMLKEIESNLFGDDLEDLDFDWSQKIPRNIYCKVFDLMPTACLYLGILDIWPSSANVIESLTQEDIIQGVNLVTESAAYAYPVNFTSFLGGITRNSTGHIVGAESCLHLWNMEINRTELQPEKRKKLSAGLSLEVNEALYNWEGAFINIVLKESELGLPEGLSMWPQAIRSFMEVSEQTIFGDVKYLATGTIILSIYVFLMLGKCNLVETRPVLSCFGILSIVLAVVFSFGFCAGMGIVYGPIHSILPILLLGLGVDDMFVIVQHLENIEKSRQEPSIMTIEEKMGKVLSNAGVAITVTSLTDFMAFGIGSTTALPALRSFSMYAALGIVSLYLMQITFFFAALTLDQTRLEADRDGFLWCVKHRHWEPNQCSQNNYCQMLFERIYAPWLLKPASKIIVLVTTAILTAFCIWGVTNLRQEFNIIWFIPRTSYVSKFMTKVQHFYPEAGNAGTVYIENIDLPRELPNLRWLTKNMEKNKWISTIDSWYNPLVQYTLSDTGVNLEKDDVTAEVFAKSFTKFLFSSSGAKFQSYIYFNGTLKCEENAPEIKACKFNYRHHVIEGRDDQIQAMEEMKLLVKNANFSGFSACTSFWYSEWETNKIIVKEIAQNLSLALVTIFIMTSLLIVNLWASLLVLLCVILTLTDVMALMNWWGLTIDTVTCINLVLCVGLSVDYSAHIALHFMKVKGSRDKRVMTTLSEVGPPVFNGAFSTFLAIVLLSNSDSHVFESFFKIFFGVFIYGVYHGLVFLPIVLSLIGPLPYLEKETRGNTEPEYNSELEMEERVQFTTCSFSS